MAILDKIKYGIDIPRWQQLSPLLNAHAAGVGLCSDKRNNGFAYDAIFQLASAAILNVIFGETGAGGFLVNPGLSAYGAGSAVAFVPSFGFVGNIGVGSTTTNIITSTSITSQVQDSFVLGEGSNGIYGAILRVIHKAAGGTGTIEERMIIGNSAGTTPALKVSPALVSAPVNGDTYEILSCRVYCLGNGATSATQFRYNEVGTTNMVSCAATGLTLATDSSMIVLDEQYVPYDRQPGEGFIVGAGSYDAGFIPKGCLTATAVGVATLTGEIAIGDIGVLANEYRNFQIRIVEDTGTPTAVGQRGVIASHTAGVLGTSTAPVYTMGTNWAVRPSNNAKYVIENPNLILLFTVAAGTTIYTYNYGPLTVNNGTASIATNVWSTTYFGARGTVVAAGCFTIPSWGHEPTTMADGSRNSRHSYIYSFRGGAITLDLLDIAGGVAGAWTNGVGYKAQQTAFSTGSGGDYANIDNQGQWGYWLLNTTGLCGRFNVKYRSMFPWPTTPVQSGTAAVGNRICVTPYIKLDGSDKLSKIHVQAHLSTLFYRSEAII